jgi:hypothetical protein
MRKWESGKREKGFVWITRWSVSRSLMCGRDNGGDAYHFLADGDKKR